MGSCLSSPSEPPSRRQTTATGNGQRLGSGVGTTPSGKQATSTSGGVVRKQGIVPGSTTTSSRMMGTGRTGKTLGGESASSPPPEDPRVAAALAAERRNVSKSTGKLSAKLEDERRKGKARLLQEESIAQQNAKAQPLVFD
ncbi:hypothetical protein POJ06DRAFT_150382 [Lipomyces tetrasporus]|uniref:Uncharacterized protein n=1 Tax=Lipomyces tetrasporus TaxID=54092 RepID=A0AAD7QNL8_9ASCO|nr:uncharacterized protein POJ06DRAFT_150382 [Lipomyces tetrasporus]KAJ8098373.1 hypothetical protein POJ06DRAFT_150382 [Lipomyces tetrasporus]